MYIWKEKRGVFVESFFWLFSLEKFLCRPTLMHSDLTYKESHCWTIIDEMFLYINKTFTFNGISIIWILFWYHRYNQHSVHLNFWVFRSLNHFIFNFTYNLSWEFLHCASIIFWNQLFSKWLKLSIEGNRYRVSVLSLLG